SHNEPPSGYLNHNRCGIVPCVIRPGILFRGGNRRLRELVWCFALTAWKDRQSRGYDQGNCEIVLHHFHGRSKLLDAVSDGLAMGSATVSVASIGIPSIELRAPLSGRACGGQGIRRDAEHSDRASRAPPNQ